MFDKIFVLPQGKRIVIISNKHGIYELPHELPNDLRLRKLGNIKKISKLYRTIAWRSVLLPKLKFCQYQQKILEKQKLNFSHRVLFHRKTTVCLRYFGQDCSSYKTFRITHTWIDEPSQTFCSRISVYLEILRLHLAKRLHCVSFINIATKHITFAALYTNADLKIRQYLLLHMEMIC